MRWTSWLTLGILALAILLVLGEAISKADFLTLDNGYVEAVQYLPGSFDPSLPGMGQSYNLGLDFKLPGPLYWDNRVLSWTDGKQFREIGYNFELGAKFDRLQVFLGHESDHALDSQWPWPYPRYYSVGVRYTFIGDK